MRYFSSDTVRNRMDKNCRTRRYVTGNLREQTPKPCGGSLPDPRYESFHDGYAGKQHLALDETSGGVVGEDTGSLGTQSGPGVEPPHQTEYLVWIAKIAVAIGLLDLCGMVPMRLRSVVTSQTTRVLDVELMATGLTTWSGTATGSGRKVPRNRTVPS